MGRPKGAAGGAKATAFRLPEDLLARVDAYAERLKAEAPWSNATRADAVRALLLLALRAVEREQKRSEAPLLTAVAPSLLDTFSAGCYDSL